MLDRVGYCRTCHNLKAWEEMKAAGICKTCDEEAGG